jgi:hypothetical protein
MKSTCVVFIACSTVSNVFGLRNRIGSPIDYQKNKYDASFHRVSTRRNHALRKWMPHHRTGSYIDNK